MKQILKDQRGMTLMELMAAMQVGVILMAATAGIYVFACRQFRQITEIREAGQIVIAIEKFLERQIACADTLVLGETQEVDCQSGKTICVTEKGRLTLDGEPVFEEAFYHGWKLRIKADEERTRSNSAIVFTISLEKGKKLTFYSETFVVKLLNLERNGEPIQFRKEAANGEFCITAN